MSDSAAPESFYRKEDTNTTTSSYQPYRPHDEHRHDSEESSAQNQMSASEYQTYHAPAARPPYPTDDDMLSPRRSDSTNRHYQPYKSADARPSHYEQPDIPEITIESPTPITPSNSLRRVPGGFPVENRGGQPIRVSGEEYGSAAPQTSDSSAHHNTYATPEIAYSAYEPSSSAHSVPEVHVEEVSGHGDGLAAYQQPPAQTSATITSFESDPSADELYALDTPVLPKKEFDTVTEEPTVRHDVEAGPSGLPAYMDPENSSIRNQYVGSGKAPMVDHTDDSVPPIYEQSEGVSLEDQPIRPEKARISDAIDSSAAPPLYDQPEGPSTNYEPKRTEKAPLTGDPEHKEEAPPRYSTIGGVPPAIAAQSSEKTPFSPVSPIEEESSKPRPATQEFYPPEKAGGGLGIGSEWSSAPNRPIPNTPPPLPPRRAFPANDNPLDLTHYLRDPHKLVAYLIPFPKPIGKDLNVPDRFLIYTPPPPPLVKPAEGGKETKTHKMQRKWQAEVRSAKTSTAKTKSWAGIRSKATKGVDWAMGQTVSANLEFLTRLQPTKATATPKPPKSPKSRTRSPSPANEKDAHADDGVHEEPTTHKTVGLEEMVLVYPSGIPGDHETLRKEFIETMLRSKSKAERDAVIATGLLPVTFAIDVLTNVILPVGGIFEIDAVWAYSSIRGARIARSTTKRLTSTGESEDLEKDKLKLTFQPSERLEILQRYLAAKCHDRNPKRFGSAGVGTTESEVLEAIGWSPSIVKTGEKNWEDEQWEITSVKDDLQAVMSKGAREWDRWVKKWEDNPEKAAKK